MRTIMTPGAANPDQSLPKAMAGWRLMLTVAVVLAAALPELELVCRSVGVHPQPSSIFRGVPWTALALYLSARCKGSLRACWSQSV